MLLVLPTSKYQMCNLNEYLVARFLNEYLMFFVFTVSIYYLVIRGFTTVVFI